MVERMVEGQSSSYLRRRGTEGLEWLVGTATTKACQGVPMTATELGPAAVEREDPECSNYGRP
jgi:hypothetical protein